MKIKYKFLFVTLLFGMVSLSQETTSEEQLDEILITSSRIDLPFSENSRTITVITSEDIKNSTATNVTDLLQSVAGLDIRRIVFRRSRRCPTHVRGSNLANQILTTGAQSQVNGLAR